MSTGSAIDDETFEWGASDRLNALETVMWRAEVDPALSSTVMVLEILDREPDWERFHAAHEWGAQIVPRFRQRVVDGPGGLGQPSWVVDPRFDLERHVRRVRLEEGATMRDVFDRARDIAKVPFDRSRPPWQAVLIEGLPDGKAAYVLKMHHSTLDGLAGMQLLGGLHSRRREPSPKRALPPVPVSGSTSLVTAVAGQAGRDVRGAVGAAWSVPGRLLRLGRPDRAARDAARYVASLRRVLGDATPGSPLLAQRSTDWWFGALDVEFAPLRAAAKSAGASLNDAFLAALLGGFRRYHDELGVPIEQMPFAIPISIRRPDDPAGGNQFAGARMCGPVAERDPVRRMHLLGELVRGMREEPALNGLGAVAPAMARLPGPVIAQLTGALTKANDLQASNVPGLREDSYVAGAKVERMYGYGPLPGCATMIALLTHGPICCVGINLDPAAVTEPQRFGRCLVEGFQEVLDLVPGATPPVWRG